MPWNKTKTLFIYLFIYSSVFSQYLSITLYHTMLNPVKHGKEMIELKNQIIRTIKVINKEINVDFQRIIMVTISTLFDINDGNSNEHIKLG